MSDLDRYQYGYDQNSNRLWKANVVGTAAVGNLDEGYAYDNLNRLTQMQRGTLSGGVITGTPVREMDYTLDPTGKTMCSSRIIACESAFLVYVLGFGKQVKYERD